ncbi:hypothetical protein GCM10020370_58730 [Paenibacillus hodogayensis]
MPGSCSELAFRRVEELERGNPISVPVLISRVVRFVRDSGVERSRGSFL